MGQLQWGTQSWVVAKSGEGSHGSGMQPELPGAVHVRTVPQSTRTSQGIAVLGVVGVSGSQRWPPAQV